MGKKIGHIVAKIIFGIRADWGKGIRIKILASKLR